ncbi:MAG: hypothetical protein HY904_17835 [Deltaproteobacteria bacterium]|nr:hypothetical protein [Deltaproteobacteria bacterium]
MAPTVPRHFVAHSGDAGAPGAPLPPRRALDLLRLSGPHRQETELAVCADAAGTLRGVSARASDLPPSVREDLSHHQLSSPGPAWTLRASELWLMDVQALEQPLATPGLNDPVHLFGSLVGPVPETAGPGVRGRLTVTRADLLGALVQGAAAAFRTPGPGSTGLCFHALLPGGDDVETVTGHALVLAYPMAPAELGLEDVANELLVAQMIHDLLGALQADLRHERVDHPLRDTVIPVPSRALLESELAANGYLVKGNTAVKQRAGGVDGGMLNSVFGWLAQEKTDLPPEGSVQDFLELARAALGLFPGWPTPRARALADCLSLRGVSPVVPRPGPARGTAPPVPHRPAPAGPAPTLPAGPADWMRDFTAPGAGPVRVTRITARPRARTPAPPAATDWMRDFPSTRAPATRAPAAGADQPGPGRKPDWMKDFE